MAQLRFTKDQHLRTAADFARVYELRIVARTKFLTVFAAPNPEGALRIGLSVSKKHGNAVVRNRLKRLLREAFRQICRELPKGIDLILIPVVVTGQDRGATLDDFQSSLIQAVGKLARKLDRGAVFEDK